MPRLAFLLLSFLGMIALLCYLAYQASVPRTGVITRPTVSDARTWTPLVDTLPTDTLTPQQRTQVMRRMAADYHYLSIDTLPPVVAHEAFSPTDCEGCWKSGAFAPLVDLQPLSPRFEALWGVDSAGLAGLEVRCFVPKNADLKPASFNYRLSGEAWRDAAGNVWEGTLSDAELLSNEAYPTATAGLDHVPPLASTVAVPDSEVVYRFFHRADASTAAVLPLSGTVEVVLNQYPFVQVAAFTRANIGDTVSSAYGAVRLLDWDGRRVYLEARLLNKWDQLLLFPIDANGRILLPREYSGYVPNAHRADDVHPHQYAFFKYLPTHTLEDYQRLLYPHYKQMAMIPEGEYTTEGGLQRYTLSLPADRVVLYLRHPLDNTITRTLTLP